METNLGVVQALFDPNKIPLKTKQACAFQESEPALEDRTRETGGNRA